MKQFCLLVAGFVVGSYFSSAAQSVKKAPAKSIAAANVAPFKVEDYDHYVLVERNQSSEPGIDTYSLKPTADYGRYLVFDVVTGKEVAFWPFLYGTYYSKANKMLYSMSVQTLYGFTETGLPKFKKDLKMPDGLPFKAARLSLSDDWKRSCFTYNNDLWISDFESTSGTLGEPKQVTFIGAIGGDRTYLKNDFALTTSYAGAVSGKAIDLKTGKFNEFFGPWEDTNGFITNQFYIQDRDRGMGFLVSQGFFSYSMSWHFVGWIDPEQKSFIRLNRDTNKYYVLRAEVEGIRNKVTTHELVAPITQEKGVSITLPMERMHKKSPKHKRIFERFGEGENDGVLIYDLEKMTESFHSIVTLERLTNMYDNSVAWTDDDHLIVRLTPDDIINGERITTATQGTYVYDIHSKQAKRITPYYINGGKSDDPIKQITTGDGKYTIFNANNLLFRCRPDGSELVQLTKMPNLYTLRTNFIDYHPFLK